MSRLGKSPVPVPAGVAVAFEDGKVTAKGPLGELSVSVVDGVSLDVQADSILVRRDDDGRLRRAAQGLIRRLVCNMLEGVSSGFSKKLEIIGVGYRADVKGSNVHLALGYSHPIVYQLPEGVSASVEKQTVITISGYDRQMVGEVAANIRKLRPPEPYKGKGIRYSTEHVRRKAGKTGATA